MDLVNHVVRQQWTQVTVLCRQVRIKTQSGELCLIWFYNCLVCRHTIQAVAALHYTETYLHATDLLQVSLFELNVHS